MRSWTSTLRSCRELDALTMEVILGGLAEIDGPGVRRLRVCDPCLSNPRTLDPPPW